MFVKPSRYFENNLKVVEITNTMLDIKYIFNLSYLLEMQILSENKQKCLLLKYYKSRKKK